MEILLIVVALIVGVFLGLLGAYLLKPKITYSGALELFRGEDELLVGVDIQTTPEILQQQTVAHFQIRKAPVS